MDSESVQLGPDLSQSLSFMGTVDGITIVAFIFYTVVLFAAVFTIVVLYHWVRYGHRSFMMIPALVAHFVVSFALIGFAASGLNAL